MQRPRLFGGKRRRPHRFGAQQIAIPEIEQTIKRLHAKVEDWQRRVLDYADIVPEVQKGAKYVHNVMDRVTYEVQVIDRASNTWVADDTPEVQGIERRLNLAFRSGRAASLGHLVEECFLLV